MKQNSNTSGEVYLEIKEYMVIKLINDKDDAVHVNHLLKRQQ